MWFYPARVLIHEGRVLQACLARDRDRRPRARLAAAPPGRYGNPPPVTMNRREELADGAEAVRVARASRKARPRTEKSPNWSAAKRASPRGEAKTEYGCAKRRSGPLAFLKRGLRWKNAPDAQKKARARERWRLSAAYRLSFRGASAAREPGIQKHTRASLDSGQPLRGFRNDAERLVRAFSSNLNDLRQTSKTLLKSSTPQPPDV